MFQTNKNITFIIKLLIFSGIIIYLYYFISLDSIISILKTKSINFSPIYLLIFLILSFMTNIFNLQRFKLISKNFINKNIKQNDFTQIIFYSSLASEAGNAFLFIARYFLSKKINLNLKSNIYVLIIEKLLSLLFFIIYFIIFLITINILFVILLFIFFLFLYFLSKIKILKKKIKFFSGKYKAFSYSIFLQLTVFLQLYVCTKIMNFELSNYQILFVIPSLIFLSSFTPTFSDWGYREFVFVLFLDFFSYLREEAFLLSIAFGLLTLFSSFFLVILFEIYSYTLKLFFKKS